MQRAAGWPLQVLDHSMGQDQSLSWLILSIAVK
jgi:hypothetical protein